MNSSSKEITCGQSGIALIRTWHLYACNDHYTNMSHTRRLRSRPPTKGLLVARLLPSWYFLLLVIPHPVKMTISCIAMSDGLSGKKSQFNEGNTNLGIPTIYLDVIFAGLECVPLICKGIQYYYTQRYAAPVFLRNMMAGGELCELFWCFLCFYLLLFTLYGNI